MRLHDNARTHWRRQIRVYPQLFSASGCLQCGACSGFTLLHVEDENAGAWLNWNHHFSRPRLRQAICDRRCSRFLFSSRIQYRHICAQKNNVQCVYGTASHTNTLDQRELLALTWKYTNGEVIRVWGGQNRKEQDIWMYTSQKWFPETYYLRRQRPFSVIRVHSHTLQMWQFRQSYHDAQAHVTPITVQKPLTEWSFGRGVQARRPM